MVEQHALACEAPAHWTASKWSCSFLGLSGIVRCFFVCLREAVVQQAQNVNCGIFRAVVLVAMQFSRKLNMALSCDLSGIWTVC